MVQCPHCGAEHRWGLQRESVSAGVYHHGCRIPATGTRRRCQGCRGVFRIEYAQSEAGLKNLNLAPASPPKWYEFWI